MGREDAPAEPGGLAATAIKKSGEAIEDSPAHMPPDLFAR